MKGGPRWSSAGRRGRRAGRPDPCRLPGPDPGGGAAALFIDDCPDITICFTLGVYPAGSVPGGPIETCWNSWTLVCEPCNGSSIDSIQQLCNQTYPDQCGDSCIVYTG
jgi:hypothetical protein